MDPPRYLLLAVVVLVLGLTPSESDPNHQNDDVCFCESWKFSIESNNAGSWKTIPPLCKNFVKKYMAATRYHSDLRLVARDSLAYAATVKLGSDGKDAWVFDIDETLLSNLPYYATRGYGLDPFDEQSFNKWAETASASPIRPSLKLFYQLKKMGFKLFLITGRDESQRGATERNLRSAGYSGWEELILRSDGDKGLPATVYKSIRRVVMESQGYRIRGCSGDQWSDQLGYAMAPRPFKLPNPMYYIP